MVGPDRSALPDFPFCSSRCKLIDLGRWLGGKYHFEAEPEEPSESLNHDDDSEPA
jgi:endogenous inhibitor of DNA gyrase (YacG/DUF329 family)